MLHWIGMPILRKLQVSIKKSRLFKNNEQGSTLTENLGRVRYILAIFPCVMGRAILNSKRASGLKRNPDNKKVRILVDILMRRVRQKRGMPLEGDPAEFKFLIPATIEAD